MLSLALHGIGYHIRGRLYLLLYPNILPPVNKQLSTQLLIVGLLSHLYALREFTNYLIPRNRVIEPLKSQGHAKLYKPIVISVPVVAWGQNLPAECEEEWVIKAPTTRFIRKTSFASNPSPQVQRHDEILNVSQNLRWESLLIFFELTACARYSFIGTRTLASCLRCPISTHAQQWLGMAIIYASFILIQLITNTCLALWVFPSFQA